MPAPATRAEACREEAIAEISPELTAELAATAAKNGSPLLPLIVAGSAIVLAGIFDVEELCLGSVTAGRFDPALNEVIGYFVNPFAIRLSANSALEQVLSQAIEQVASALTHAQMPFDALVRELSPPRTRHPWFQAFVVLQKEPYRGRLNDLITVQAIRIRPPKTSTELTIEAIPTAAGGMQCIVSWRSDGIQLAVGEQIAAELLRALSRIATVNAGLLVSAAQSPQERPAS
ncbi:condensation domain-containing protein [Renibacterium salmoninarum]|uniref:condensation domain-containing protein n=1 Tax=Renibacterium salmoninarum TaxID=1646 RepID=UPI0005A08870|nr:condensation domain-containing protein [Renibacterium salmoninarum]